MRRLPFLFLSLSFGLALISAIPVAPPTNIAEEAAARSPPPLPLPTINQDFGIGIKAFFRRVRAKFFRTKTSDRIISTFATPSTSSLDPMSSFSSTAAYAGGSSDRWRSLSIPDETAILPFRRPSVRAPLPPLPPIIDDGQKRDLPKLWNARKSFDASSGSGSGSTSHRRKVSLEFASASSSPRRPARPLSPKTERRGKELERSPKIKSVRIIEDAPRRGSVASMRSFTFPLRV